MSPSAHIPPFYCPIPAGIHPAAYEINNRSIEWMNRLNLGISAEHRQKLAAGKFGLLASLTSPEGTADGVQWSSDWLYWSFALDDARDLPDQSRPLEEVAAHTAKLQRTLEVPCSDLIKLEEDPLAEGIVDLMGRLDVLATPTQRERFSNTMRQYFFAELWETSLHRRGLVPGLNEWTSIRIGVGGGLVAQELAPIVNVYEVRSEEMDAPPVRALMEMCALLTAWDNDLYSYHVETNGQVLGFNLPDVLRHVNGYSVHEALGQAAAWRDRVMHLFLRLRNQVSASASPALRRFLHNQGQWIRGNIAWGLTSNRYSPDATTRAVRSQTGWSSQPRDSSLDPLPLPSIAWWWEQLS
ncbi:hypothetical protein ACIHFC_28465 [Streptomyces sp. NPDC052013]|uniref:terpene synthase family protein n=1 Tax=Streptomyces sp. NPDC052013 TaxID=3365679 RepID=UPI0037D1DED8